MKGLQLFRKHLNVYLNRLKLNYFLLNPEFVIPVRTRLYRKEVPTNVDNGTTLLVYILTRAHITYCNTTCRTKTLGSIAKIAQEYIKDITTIC